MGQAAAMRMSSRPAMAAASPGEKRKVEMYSPEFYRASVIGGILSCGLTHTAVRAPVAHRAVPRCRWAQPLDRSAMAC